MKRPLALWCISLVLASMVALSVGITVCAAVLAASAAGLCAAVLLSVKKKSLLSVRAVVVLSAMLVAFSIASAEKVRDSNIAKRYASTTAEVVCTVREVTKLDTNFYAVDARVNSVGGDKERFDIRFVVHDAPLPYERIRGRLTFDANTERLSAGMLNSYSIVGEGSRFMRFFHRLRSGIETALRSAVGGQEGEVAAAITTGDRSGIEYPLMSAFTRSGATHILVVSGMHISIIIVLLSRLIAFIPIGHPARLAFLIAVSLFLIFTIGFTPSVIRAGLMTVLVASAYLVKRESDSLTVLLFSAAVIVLIDQSFALSAAFLLSFSCVFALTVVMPFINLKLYDVLRRRQLRGRAASLINALLTPVVIQLVTLPVLMLLSLSVSLVAPLSNILILWLMPAALTLSLATAAAYWLFGGGAVSLLLGFLTRGVIWFVNSVCTLLGAIPFAQQDVSADWYKVYAVVYILLGALFYALWRRKASVMKFLCCAAALLAVGLSLRLLIGINTRRVEVIGRGDSAIMLDGESGRTLLFDDCTEYGASRLCDLMIARRERIADVIFTAPQKRGARLFLDNVEAERLYGFDEVTEMGTSFSYLAPLSDGTLTMYIADGKYSYGIVSQRGALIGIMFDCEKIPHELNKCDIIIATDAPPAAGSYAGELISLDRYGDRVVIYVYKNGRIRISD